MTLTNYNNNAILAEDNPMPVKLMDVTTGEEEQIGHVCTDNTTTNNILAGSTFTGAWQDTLNYNNIIIGINSDQDSAVDGLVIQWSVDGVTIHDEDVFTIYANAGKVFTFCPARRYVRLVYTNGSVDTSSFNLQTIFKKGGIKASSHRIQDNIVTEDDVELVKSVLTGETPSGTFKNVNVSSDGNLYISDESSGLSIAEGNVTGKSYVHKFGLAPDFDQGDGEVTIWDGANDGTVNQMTYVWSSTAAIDSISSGNAGDTQTIQIQGLDANWDLVIQTITLNGQTRVALTTSLLRIFRLKNSGTTALSGIVYVYENTAITAGKPDDTTKIKAIINNGNNQTLMALYSVPQDKTAYMRDWYASTAGASKSSSYIIRLWAREYIEASSAYGAWQLKQIMAIADGGTTYIQHQYNEPEKFVGKVDLMMTAEITEVGASGAAISAGFDIVLVDD